MKYIIIALLVMLIGCNKSEFLNAKPSSNLVIPRTISDFSQLLDKNYTVTPCLPFISSDEFYYPTTAVWQSLSTATERNSYIWERDLFGGETKRRDWNDPYNAIFYSNVVLDEFNKLSDADKNSPSGREIYGRALFYRGFIYYHLAISFAKQYDSVTAKADLGLPLKLTSGIDDIVQRSSLEDTYRSILSDVHGCIKELPRNVLINAANRPSVFAAYALLSRIYLSMGRYSEALTYADSVLNNYNALIDFNTLSQTAVTPFPVQNPEVLFMANSPSAYVAVLTGSSGVAVVDSVLYKSYANDDLRRAVYFRSMNNLPYLKNGYSTFSGPFSGLAVDEIYLIRAECYARQGQILQAMDDLNALLRKRWKSSSTYTNLTAIDKSDALSKVLLERKKELVWRGLRWSDLKRLNKEGANITLKRLVNNLEYTLEPNSAKYVFPIPDDEVSLSGVTQNSR